MLFPKKTLKIVIIIIRRRRRKRGRRKRRRRRGKQRWRQRDTKYLKPKENKNGKLIV